MLNQKAGPRSRFNLNPSRSSVTAPASSAAWSAVAGGVSLTVRLTPKGGRDAIDGIERLADGTMVLKIRVRAAPSEGEANDALIRLLARTFRVPARDVALVAGAGARVKRLTVAGDGPTLAAALEKIAQSS